MKSASAHKMRKSNYELMRIVSMFMIVLWHFLIHSKVTEGTSGVLNIILNLSMVFLIVHVSSFVLVMGYHQCDKKLKLGKVFSLVGQMWFYRVIITLVLTATGLMSVNELQIAKLLSPISLDEEYWYMHVYILLYCLTPFLNKMIHTFEQKQYKKLIIVLFVFFTILPTITVQKAFFNNNGYLITTFVLLYLVGAYFKQYPIDKSYLMKKCTPTTQQLLFLGGFFFFGFLNFLMWNFGNVLSNFGNISKEISTTILHATYVYDNPFVFLQSICYFLWFGTLKLKSKFINRIGTLTLGVYLIHENLYLREILYGQVRDKLAPYLGSFTIIPLLLLTTLICFLFCIFLEWIRQIIFSFLSNRKWNISLREKFKSWVASLGLVINW